MLRNDFSLAGTIKEWVNKGIGIEVGHDGDIHFRREDICKRSEKLMKLLKTSENHIIKQLL